MIEYTVRAQLVEGLEIPYTQYLVGYEVLNAFVIIGSFMHEQCADTLRQQLQDAHDRGFNEAVEALELSEEHDLPFYAGEWEAWGGRRMVVDTPIDAEAAAEQNPPEDSNRI